MFGYETTETGKGLPGCEKKIAKKSKQRLSLFLKRAFLAVETERLRFFSLPLYKEVSICCNLWRND